MIKKNLWTVLILALLAMTVSACSLLSEPPAPSTELETAPLEVQSLVETAPAEEETAQESLADESPLEEAPLQQASTQEPPAAETPVAAGAGLLIYQIDPAASQVRFELDEVLRGSPKTVVGITDQVSGEIAADLQDLTNVQVGEIRINARTLTTDNDFRNRALNNQILETGAYEFITFVPSAVHGLPQSAAVGSTIEFTIDGDLTIRDSTMPVTFAVTASPVSDTQLVGSAAATITRADFNLVIPTVRNVADVEEEVELYIDFVANVP